jgi:hypothetical protein
MKKFTLLSSLVLMAAGSVAAADGDSQWVNYLDGPTTSGVCPEVIAYDANSVYWLTTAGTKDGSLDVTYNGEKLFEGSKSATTSANHNVCLIKLDKAGNKLYTVYSNSGETWTNQNGVVPTSDGGAVVALNMRHAEGYLSDKINFVDAKGTNHTIDWECGESRYNSIIVLKVDKDGVIEWTRRIDMEHPKVNGAEVVVSVDLLSVVGDDNDNIYLAGRYVMPMHLPKADGTEVVITPDNKDKFTSDFTQNACGDVYLVKLNSEGYYVANAASKGIVTKGSIANMIWADGALYTLGYVTGAAGETVTFANTTLPVVDKYSSVVVAKFDADLNGEWAAVYEGSPNSKGTCILQNASLSKAGNTLWIGGMGNGTFTDKTTNVSVASTSTNREGYLFKASAANGHLDKAMASYSYRTAAQIVGFFGAIQNPSGSGDVWTYGYDWQTTTSAPIFLKSFNSETLAESGTTFNLITAMTTTMYDAAYDSEEGVLYYTGRGKGTPTPQGLSAGDKATNWKGFIGKATLPESLKKSTSSISNVNIYDGVEVSAGAGCLTVANGGADTVIYVYDIVGRKVANVNVAAETTVNIELPGGVYIAGGKKFLVK